MLNTLTKSARGVAPQHGSCGWVQNGIPAGSGGTKPAALQIEDVDEDKSSVTTPKKYNVMYMPTDYTLSDLYDMWKKNVITVPEFQRGYVWTHAQASRLIESFWMDLPVPPVFLMMDKEENALVIDGMQRLLTIFYFFDGWYGKRGHQESRQEFRIVGISKDSEIYGKRFDDLSEYIQKELKSQLLRAILIRQDPPDTSDANGTVIYHIFERLNMGGTALSEQEIRNCIYSGKLNDLLHDVNCDKDWRKIIGKPDLDSRMNDLQLVLRCIALVHRSDRYRKPMKDFLSGFMHTMRNPTEGFILREKERFGNVCRDIIDLLGERPFHNSRGVLKATLLDAAFVAFARNDGDAPVDIKERLESLKNDPTFASPSGASTDASAVEKRLGVASRVLFG